MSSNVSGFTNCISNSEAGEVGGLLCWDNCMHSVFIFGKAGAWKLPLRYRERIAGKRLTNDPTPEL